jgi:flavin-dependent dehydrogenase
MRGEIDAVVVGAGPAGSAAAATMAQAGLTTVVLAGGYTPRWVETVPPDIAGLLPDIGLPQAVIRTVGHACRQSSGQPALHIDRAAFDALLRNAASRAGATLSDRRAVGVIRQADRIAGVRTDRAETLHCRTVIDASGSRAWLARQLGQRTQTLSPALRAWRGEVASIHDGMADDAARFCPRHDGWLFLATCRGRTTWTVMARGRRPPDLALARQTTRPAAWDVTWRLARPVAGRGWLLAGDAAGRLDPAWGQGLVSAVASGVAAGRTAVACLADQASESIYLAAYDGWFADRIHAAAAILRQRYADNGIHLAAEPAAD